MRNLKKALSLTLVLALSLALAVPAFADWVYYYSANDFTDPTAENVEFSVAPIGVATIRWVSPDPIWGTREYTAYVFDQDCVVTRKDGLPLVYVTVEGYGEGHTGNINSSSWWPYERIKSAELFADDDSGCAYSFGPAYTGEGEEDPSPYIISKKSLDTVFPYEYEDEWMEGRMTGTVVEYRPLSAQPTQPTQPTTPDITVENIPASGTAVASTQTVTVDGKAVEFQMYALLDANGNPTNYIKLRDMAYVLNGTRAQFAVGYDGTISLTTGQPYAAGGTEMTTPYSGNRAYKGGAQTVKINGADVAMTAITLTDDSGGDYNYFKLRDLGAALGFNVGWDNGVIIESDKPYVG